MTQTVLLGDIVRVRRGSSPRPIQQFIQDRPGIPWVKIADATSANSRFIERTNEYIKEDGKKNSVMVAPETLIMSNSATPGLPMIMKIDACVHDGWLILDELKGVDRNWLYYYLLERRVLSAREASGSVFSNLKTDIVRGFKLDLPDIETQQRIAGILWAIDEKIELNRKMNETLEQMGQALFRHYFIDNPEAEKWQEKPLDEIANFLNGLAMQKYPKVVGEPVLPVIKIREMSSGITANTDIASANIPEQYVVHNGDLLFSWSGTLLVKFWTEGAGALNQHLFKVTSEDYPEWLYYYWTKHHLDDFIQTAKSKATTMGHIQRKHLNQAMVRVPDAEMMQKIGDQIQPLIDACKENSRQIQTLTTLRDTLLPRLINGKVRV